MPRIVLFPLSECRADGEHPRQCHGEHRISASHAMCRRFQILRQPVSSRGPIIRLACGLFGGSGYDPACQDSGDNYFAFTE